MSIDCMNGSNEDFAMLQQRALHNIGAAIARCEDPHTPYFPLDALGGDPGPVYVDILQVRDAITLGVTEFGQESARAWAEIEP